MASETSVQSDKNGYSKLDENTCSQITESAIENPRNLISKICNDFYHLGWATGKHM